MYRVTFFVNVFSMMTPLKINMEPKNHLFEKEHNLPNLPWNLCSMLVFRGVLAWLVSSLFTYVAFCVVVILNVVVQGAKARAAHTGTADTWIKKLEDGR